MGWFGHPYFFFFFFIDLKGWPSHPFKSMKKKMKKKKKKKIGVAEPPHRGWLAPLGPWGWFGHPQIG
jgi:hypothetical protein